MHLQSFSFASQMVDFRLVFFEIYLTCENQSFWKQAEGDSLGPVASDPVSWIYIEFDHSENDHLWGPQIRTVIHDRKQFISARMLFFHLARETSPQPELCAIRHAALQCELGVFKVLYVLYMLKHISETLYNRTGLWYSHLWSLSRGLRLAVESFNILYILYNYAYILLRSNVERFSKGILMMSRCYGEQLCIEGRARFEAGYKERRAMFTGAAG